MKLLITGLLPVLAFWFVEERFGTLWGIVAAMVWAALECSAEYILYKRMNKMTLGSGALVVVMGGIGLALDNSAWFKFQPVILEMAFVVFLVLQNLKPVPLLYTWAKAANPDRFQGVPGIDDRVLQARQIEMIKKMSWGMAIGLSVHSGVVGYFAVYGSTSEWVFWKTGGLFVIMGVWLALHMIWLRFQTSRKKPLP